MRSTSPAGSPSTISRAEAMRRLMQPASVAIVGASTDPKKFSGRVIDYLSRLGYAGKVYPIHPEAPSIAGFACFKDIADIPGGADAVVIARPARDVPDEMEKCIAAGVRAFVVLGGGFAEAGPEGVALQDSIVRMARESGAVVCGPNCSGLANLATRSTLAFMSSLDKEMHPGGTIALVSNSGSIAAMVLQDRGRLFNAVVSTGNEAVLSSADYIRYALADDTTHGVAAYIEGIRDAGALLDAAQYADAHGKPLAILKAGRSSAAAEIAASHTGAMIDDDAVIGAVFERYRVIRVDSIDELKEMAVLMHAGAARTLGARVAIVTPSGGTAVLLADEITRWGLTLAQFSGSTVSRLHEIAPNATAHNPMDVTGFGIDPVSLAAATQAVIDDPQVDVLLAPMAAAVGEQGLARAQALIEVCANSGKLLIPIWQATVHNQLGYRALVEAGVPVFTDHAAACRALARLVRWHGRRAEADVATAAPAQSLPREALALIEAGAKVQAQYLNEPEVKAVFAAAGIAVPRALRLAGTDAAKYARDIHYPAVLKIVSRQIIHKSVVGGVRFLHAAGELEGAVSAMAKDVSHKAAGAGTDGFLLEEVVIGGVELLVGLRRDAQYGLTLTLSHGGVLANALAGNAVTSLLPLDDAQAHETVRRFMPALAGTAAQRALAQALCTFAAIATAYGERLAILEINPLKLMGGLDNASVVALDGVVEFKTETRRT